MYEGIINSSTFGLVNYESRSLKRAEVSTNSGRGLENHESRAGSNNSSDKDSEHTIYRIRVTQLYKS